MKKESKYFNFFHNLFIQNSYLCLLNQFLILWQEAIFTIYIMFVSIILSNSYV